MPVMDEFQEERERIKNGTLKEKLSYFLYYYKWHALGVIGGIAVIISLIHTIATQKEMAFYSVMLNSRALVGATEYANEFGRQNDIDLKKYEVMFESDLFYDPDAIDQYAAATAQKLMTYLAAGDLDTIVSSPKGIRGYGYQEALMDMRTFLTPEQLERYKDDLYYVDWDIVDIINRDDYNADVVIDYPENPFDPTTMNRPVPVGVRANGCEKMQEYYYYGENDIVFGVFLNTEHPDLCKAFFRYIFEE